MADPIRDAAERLLRHIDDYDPIGSIKRRVAVDELRAALAAHPPAPAIDPSDFQTLHGIALDMVESLRPIVIPQILDVLREAIKRPQSPAPASDGEREEREELADAMKREASAAESAGHLCFMEPMDLARAATLLRQPAPAPAAVPVAVSQRPWEWEVWCADWGWCWVFVQGQWLRDYPQNHRDAVCLPHWAIPIPQPPQSGKVQP